MSIDYVIAGTGRSGTAFAMELLKAAGSQCGGETVFSWDRPRTMAYLTGDLDHDLDGDSSLAAFAYLDFLDADVKILHLLRHPLEVLGSWLGGYPATPGYCLLDLAVLDFEQGRNHYGHFLPEEVPAINKHTDTVDRVITYIAEASALATARARGRPYRIVHLEDLTTDPELVNDVLEWLDVPTLADPAATLAELGKVNASKTRPSIDWHDLADQPTLGALALHAYTYGYLIEK